MKRRLKTHCVHGHEFTHENTLWRKDNGVRQCRTCARHNFERWKRRSTTIIRGQRIEELSHQDLLALSAQIEDELPTLIDQLGAGDLGRLMELEVLDEELERRGSDQKR